MNRRGRPFAADRLADRPLAAGEARHLRQVRHADDLVGLAQGGEFAAEHVAEPTADVGVDLVEDERADRVVGREHRLKGQHRSR